MHEECASTWLAWFYAVFTAIILIHVVESNQNKRDSNIKSTMTMSKQQY